MRGYLACIGVMLVAACSSHTASPCTTGESIVCIGPGGCDGTQTCELSGAYSACACFAVDAGATDSGVDVPGVRNVSDGGSQAMDVGVDAPAADTGVAAFPSTCAQVRAAMPTALDGSYTLYASGDPTRPWTAYCYGMIATPTEYLTLVNIGGDFNFSQNTAGGLYTSSTSVRTTYTRVRIDPITFAVTIGDQRFSTSTGMLVNGSTTITSMPYGVAGNCSSTPTGIGNIDLRGTAFSVMPAAFMAGGDNQMGTATYSDSNQVVGLLCSGTCGWIEPLSGPYAPFNMAMGTLGLVYGN